MNVALWIIAVCEVVRAVQNMMQISMARHDLSNRDNAYAEFIQSLRHDDSEFVKRVLEEYERLENDGK